MSIKKEIHDIWLSRSITAQGSVRLENFIRLSRNLSNHTFPIQTTAAKRHKIALKIQEALKTIPNFDQEWIRLAWDKCSLQERALLQHLCQLEYPCEELLIYCNLKTNIFIIVNDGDALHIQTGSSTNTLSDLWQVLDDLDTTLSQTLTYAFDATKGFATSNPSNLGTGLDIKVTLHLPGLCFNQKLNQTNEALQIMHLKLDAVISQQNNALGHLFCLNNRIAFGCSENDLIQHIDKIAEEIVAQEKQLRNDILQHQPNFVKDSICRSIGLLKNCYELTYEESMNLISVVSLGINLGILSNYKKEALILLWRSMHVDMLREFCGKDFDSSEENRVRADIVRSHFSEFEDCFAFQKEDVHVS